ncbi:MAG: 30S ribosomal protein S6 [Ignavibacteriales bacterium]|nr:30S ribosomal protein S6 [Ignavibacteriales bacterium]
MDRNHYESVLIINANLEDDQIEVTLNKVEENIKGNGGEIVDLDKWGRKRLAYPIKKSKTGYYAVIRFVAPTDAITRLERSYKFDDSILRYLTIKLDKKALEYYAKEKPSKPEDLEEIIPLEIEKIDEIETEENTIINDNEE